MNNQKQPHYIHRLTYTTQERIVGIFVVLGLFILFGLFVLNSRSLHLFEDYIEVALIVDRAEGVGTETPVRVSGIRVGRVNDIQLTPENLVRINLRIYETYTHMLRTNSRPAITLSLLGRTTIDFNTGDPNLASIRDGEVFYVDSPFSVEKLLTKAGPLLDSVEQTIINLENITEQIEPESIAHLINNTNTLVQNMAHLSQEITNRDSLANKLLTDEDFAEQVTELIANIESLLQITEHRITSLGPIIDDLAPIMSNTREAAPFLPELLRETTTALEYLNDTLAVMQPEMQNMPELLLRINLLMEQSEDLLNKVSGMWFLPTSPEHSKEEVELVPHG